MRWLTWVLFLGALTGSLFFCSSLSLWAEPSQAALGTRVAPPDREVFACGIVEGSQREIRLRFELSGMIVDRPVSEGQPVHKGDVLARLEPAHWESQLLEAESNLRLARAEYERLLHGARNESRAVLRAALRLSESRLGQARQRLAREEMLATRKATPQANLDDARADSAAAAAAFETDQARLAEIEAPAREDEQAVALAKVAVADARVRQARAGLEKSVLRAPVDGVVLRVQGEVGEMTSPQSADPVITMANVEVMQTRSFVEEADAFRVRAGQRARVMADGLANRSYTGTVTFTAPYMVPKRVFNNMPGERVDVKVREVVIRLDPQQDLVVGLPVDVFIHLDDSEPTSKSSNLARSEPQTGSQTSP